MEWVSTKAMIRAHMADDARQFSTLQQTSAAHDLNVNEKHATNTATLARIEAAQTEMRTNLDVITRLRPAIEAGIAADTAVEYRKMVARRVMVAIISTLVTVSGLIPLLSWLLQLKVVVKSVGTV